ncbi:MAG TPA: methylmalonyl-CoA epimerase [Bdellovibrionales bacterium]|nr:methylmalonyl-CoA epimerase [Bdellovibrionales bacterium]
MTNGFEIDHIGIAVKSIEQAFRFYEALGWKDMKVEVVESEKVKVGFIEFNNSVSIELLEATSSDSPIAKFIEKRGEGIHHICMRVPDVQKSLDGLKDDGFRLVNEMPKAGAKGCWVAFVHPTAANGVLIELSQGGHHG